MSDDRIADVRRLLEKELGEGIIATLDETPDAIEVISSGNMAVDWALAAGGYPRGRAVEIFGPESGGKSTLMYLFAASVISEGGTFCYIDMEQKGSPDYIKACIAAFGDDLPIENVLISQPANAGAAFTVLEKMIDVVDAVVLDSVASLVTLAEVEAKPEDQHPGVQARFMSQNLRRIMPKLGRSKTCLIFINQVREKIGVLYGSPETRPGGHALRHAAVVHMRLVRREPIKEKGTVIGNRGQITVKKNQIGIPYRQADFEIIFGKGVDVAADIVKAAIRTGVVERRGSYYYLDGENIAQGEAVLTKMVRESQEFRNKLRDLVHNAMALGDIQAGSEEDLVEQESED